PHFPPTRPGALARALARPDRHLAQRPGLGRRPPVRGHLPARGPRLLARNGGGCRRGAGPGRRRADGPPRGRGPPLFGARGGRRGGVALGGGYAGLGFAHIEAAAFAAAAVGGIGNGALLPAQSTLIAGLAAPELRHRATAVSRVCTNAGFGVGGALGGLVAG